MCKDLPDEWKEYFTAILPALTGSKKDLEKIKDTDTFFQLKTYQLLTGGKE
mgnify:CR=1 FL=1